MNGVRRFLGGGSPDSPTSQDTSSPSPPPSLPSTAPLSLSSKPTWPPSPTLASDPVLQGAIANSIPGLNIRKDKSPKVPPPPASGDHAGGGGHLSYRSSKSSLNGFGSPVRANGINGSNPMSPVSSPSSPRVGRKSVSSTKRSSQALNVRDELLMSLLASEAIVDSRGYDILNSEDVEELKKESQVLSSRLIAMNKKLTTETKIRDAAVSLSKANASYKSASKQTSDQLDAANRKVEQAQRELWRVSERANEVTKKLLEHRAAVLSISVRRLEKTVEGRVGSIDGMTPPSGTSTPNRSSQTGMSPKRASSATSVQTVASKGKFDGLHFFAGHSEAVVPGMPSYIPSTPANGTVAAETTTRSSPQAHGELADLEEKLKALTAELEESNTKRTETEQELSLLHFDKEEVETNLGTQLVEAQERIILLESQADRLSSLEDELAIMLASRSAWESDQAELTQRRTEVSTLRSQMEQIQMGQAGSAEALQGTLSAHVMELQIKANELEEAKMGWEAEKASWATEREMMSGEVQEARGEVERLRAEVEALKAEVASGGELADSLRALVGTHGGVLGVTVGVAPTVILGAIGAKLGAHVVEEEKWNEERKRLEDEVHSTFDKMAGLSEELDTVRKERVRAKMEVKELEVQLGAQAAAHMTALAVAQSANPQPKIEYTGDMAKVISILEPIWAILPSAEARASKLGARPVFRGSPQTPGSPTSSPISISSRAGASLSEMDVRSLKTLYDPRGIAMSAHMGGAFTVEAFAERVQALVADDRALVERLIRFAQAHDLLKKNAERAQKLAQESNSALETYQKQVKTLEDRNISLITKQADLQDEVQWLHESIERIQAQKLEIETHAAEQAETCAQLTDANNQLSARALIMADEAASATDSVRKQLEAHIAELNASLKRAKEDVDGMRESQQSQQMALLEELNSVQTENSNLRAQLRGKR